MICCFCLFVDDNLCMFKAFICFYVMLIKYLIVLTVLFEALANKLNYRVNMPVLKSFQVFVKITCSELNAFICVIFKKAIILCVVLKNRLWCIRKCTIFKFEKYCLKVKSSLALIHIVEDSEDIGEQQVLSNLVTLF